MRRFTSRLVTAPYANPTDQASQAALIAVTNSGHWVLIAACRRTFRATQVFIVPPQWAVCALTDDIREAARVRYLRDKVSSAEYFVAKGLADQLLSRFESNKAKPTLIKCVKNTLQLLRPSRPGGHRAVRRDPRRGVHVRAGYKALLGHDERATQRTGTTVLNVLERTPRLLETTRLFEARRTPDQGRSGCDQGELQHRTIGAGHWMQRSIALGGHRHDRLHHRRTHHRSAGRLFTPGKQKLGLLATLLLGLAGSVIGGTIASLLGTGGIFELNVLGFIVAVIPRCCWSAPRSRCRPATS